MYVKKTEVFIESIEPCSRDDRRQCRIVQTDKTPDEFLHEFARYPVMERITTESGETVVTTGDGSGNIIKYRFTL